MLRFLEAFRRGTKAGGASCEEAEGTGGFQPGDKSLRGDLSAPCSALGRGNSEVLGSAPSWELVAEGEWHRATPGPGIGNHFCTMRSQIKEQASSRAG